jgi:hypothetical protein
MWLSGDAEAAQGVRVVLLRDVQNEQVRTAGLIRLQEACQAGEPKPGAEQPPQRRVGCGRGAGVALSEACSDFCAVFRRSLPPSRAV